MLYLVSYGAINGFFCLPFLASFGRYARCSCVAGGVGEVASLCFGLIFGNFVVSRLWIFILQNIQVLAEELLVADGEVLAKVVV